MVLLHRFNSAFLSALFAVMRKELTGFFSSATGYIVIGIFLLFIGLFLWVFPGQYNIPESGYAQLDGLFELAPWIYLFLVPAVTMRMFAEENRTGTIELLYTKPLSETQIVLGKYFAGVILVMLSLIPTMTYFFSVWYLAEPIGNVDVGAFWGSFIGLFFLAIIYVAIGLFSSSLTRNQITSFLLAVFLCFFVCMGFDLIASLFHSGTVQSGISFLGINAHYESMSRGVIDLRDVVYFLSAAVFFLMVTVRMIKR
jgi:ABC-2 type transport system permease protein